MPDLTSIISPILALVAGAASLFVAQKLGVGPVQREYVDLLQGMNVTQKERIDQLETENSALRERVDLMEREHDYDRKKWETERRTMRREISDLKQEVYEVRDALREAKGGAA